jgi:hypothetical protein
MKERPRESGAFAIFARFIDLPDHHHCDPPGPDFIGPHPEAPNTVLGVELSEYFQDSQPGEGSHLKNTRDLRQQIRNKAQAAYRERNPELPLRVSLFWLEHALNRKNADNLAARLLGLLEETARQPPGPDLAIGLAYDDLERWGLEDRFSDILVWRSRPGHGNIWTSPIVSYPYTTVERIADIIAEKERKLDGYRTKCDRVWLDIHGELGALDLNDETLAHVYEAGFERVYLHDLDRMPVKLRVAWSLASEAGA